ncbi:MAG: right-handed parallel beta-helix repeat-containing protein [Actinomycetota bacterium]
MVGGHARSLRRIVSPALILLGTTSLVLGDVAPAQAGTPIGCGTTVVTSIVLDRDLIDCPTDGLIVGADAITIDLNGHTIDGPGTFDFEWDGIDNGAGHDGVTVVDGTLRDFGGVGVRLVDATGNRLSDLVLTDDRRGVEITDSSDTLIQASSIVDNFSNGIAIQGSTGTQIADNVLSNSRGGSEVLVFTSTGTSIEGNRMSGGFAPSVQSVLGSNNDVIGNVITGNVLDLGEVTDIGVSMDSPGGRIAKNEISGFDQAAIFVLADGVRVERNSLHDSLRGVALQGSFFGRPTGVVVRRNEIFDTDMGISLREMTDTLVERNVTRDSRIGIRVEDSTGTVILRNRSNENAGDGIRILDPATTVTQNRADLNGDLGIEAVEGVIDGGKNKARRNGDPAQCLNVVC